MSKSEFYKINSPKVVSETIDGEVVIVNLDKGDYYSLRKTGADIWSGIEQGLTRAKILADAAEKYSGSSEEIDVAINKFIDRLQQETLIVVNQTPAENGDDTAPLSDDLKTEEVKAVDFEPPVLEKFTDMEDLLLLDPIHEVDEEAGWPNVKAEDAEKVKA